MEIVGKREDIVAISPLVESNGFIVTTSEAVPVQIKGVKLEQADAIYKIINRLDVQTVS